MLMKGINYWRIHDKVLAATQRVASVSMAEAIGPAGRHDVERISRGEARRLRDQKSYPVIIWIREPFDRAACAYAIWSHERTGLMPDEFAHKIMAETNAHFSPQVALHTVPGVGFLPTRVYAFEDLAETWAEEFPDYPLPHFNRNDTRMSRDEFVHKLGLDIHSDLEDHYAEDQLMHVLAVNHPGVLIHDAA
jgi:hypothetical protein